MKKYIILALAFMAGATFNTVKADDIDSVSYAVGVGMGMQLRQIDAAELSVEKIAQGIADALKGQITSPNREMQQMVMEYFTKKEQEKVAKQMAEGKAFLAENGKKENVITTASGLQYKVLKQGDGQVPQMTDKVKVHYEGRLIDGTVFDSSIQRGEPATFLPTQVIKGWTEALTMMPVGSKWQLYIPQELAYGARSAGQIPPYSTLIFDVELIEIEAE